MLWLPVPPALTLREDEKDRTWGFLTVVGGSQAEAQGCFAEALQLQTRGVLHTTHAHAWAQLWASCGLDVAGPLPLRQALRGSLYYLLSELPQPAFLLRASSLGVALPTMGWPLPCQSLREQPTGLLIV